MISKLFSSFLTGSRRANLGVGALLIAVIAVLDWRVELNISMGVLYLFPMLIVGGHLATWQIAAVAALCVLLNEQLDPFPWTSTSGFPRIILTFVAYLGSGLFVFEQLRSRRLAMQHLNQIEQESELRREAEEQIKILIESSPAAILTADSGGSVLLANSAAHRLLDVAPGRLPGQPIADFFPDLARVPVFNESRSLRTVIQCQGRRSNSEIFLAGIWFSTYRTASGPRLAAIVLDASQDLRDREEFSLQQLISTTRILVGSVSHEIRNVCAAIRIVYANLSRKEGLATSEDFRALGTLVGGLEKIASTELRQSAGEHVRNVNLETVLDELRIIVEPSMRENDIRLRWDVAVGLPEVWADRESLLQVFLNLTLNSQRAIRKHSVKEIRIEASVEGAYVEVRVRDTGGGVSIPDRLFDPFQADAEGTGLGLYISRALVRSFDGDLCHEPQQSGCCFALKLRSVLCNEGARMRRTTYEKDAAPAIG